MLVTILSDYLTLSLLKCYYKNKFTVNTKFISVQMLVQNLAHSMFDVWKLNLMVGCIQINWILRQNDNTTVMYAHYIIAIDVPYFTIIILID